MVTCRDQPRREILNSEFRIRNSRPPWSDCHYFLTRVPTIRNRVGASKELSEQPAKPARDADECSRSDRRIHLIAVRVAVRVQRESDAGRERRAVHVIGQTAAAGRAATANRQIENLHCAPGPAVEDL